MGQSRTVGEEVDGSADGGGALTIRVHVRTITCSLQHLPGSANTVVVRVPHGFVAILREGRLDVAVKVIFGVASALRSSECCCGFVGEGANESNGLLDVLAKPVCGRGLASDLGRRE